MSGKVTARGFTMVELMVTLALMALLATAAFPLAELSARRDRELELRRSLREIRRAIDSYKQASDEGLIEKAADASGYPPTLKALVDGVDNRKATISGVKIYFMRRIPRDPMCDCSDRPAEQTWKLRSYVSPPDQPREGLDVFDVYSSSDGEALNGTHYRDW
ncbi:prepilin-type N-terminal cleavage/methylation domain-containing protein [Burkholderia pyrrocinia]|uniref:prepilin-type N-terminal cleavage/methylation domain-containing protein n=1 Tax=Burkholderia pyrrocinia TaxID=60550 RepID=UPI001588754C|nr:prepilin-type N-terminal cleavage/methylation domain-containing protein [Burkholderia pyrrocinia]